MPEDQARVQRHSGRAVGVLGCSAFPKQSAAWAEAEQGPAEFWPLFTSWGTRALYLGPATHPAPTGGLRATICLSHGSGLPPVQPGGVMMVAWGGWGQGTESPLTSKAISQRAIAASLHLRAS